MLLRRFHRLFVSGMLMGALLSFGTVSNSIAAEKKLTCIVPAKPGGGMDITCKLLRESLKQSNQAEVHIQYMPGGVGAVAWTTALTPDRMNGNTVVAFSGGSLLNIAEGKFGQADVTKVRWLSAFATDYGMIAVRHDSPFTQLSDLVAALKQDPSKWVIGAGGTVGSQDWLKMAYLAKASGVDPKSLRIVAFEGGGESFTALNNRLVHIVSGDASEVAPLLHEGKIRVLAIFSPQRLEGALNKIPTAEEQGYQLVWPVIRGVYMSPHTSETDYKRWQQLLQKHMKDHDFTEMRQKLGLFPFEMSGDELRNYVDEAIKQYRRRAKEFGLLR